MLKSVVSGGFATRLIAVGIGDGIDENELGQMASDPDSDNVILVDDFGSLDTIEAQLKNVICDGKCWSFRL